MITLLLVAFIAGRTDDAAPQTPTSGYVGSGPLIAAGFRNLSNRWKAPVAEVANGNLQS